MIMGLGEGVVSQEERTYRCTEEATGAGGKMATADQEVPGKENLSVG